MYALGSYSCSGMCPCCQLPPHTHHSKISLYNCARSSFQSLLYLPSKVGLYSDNAKGAVIVIEGVGGGVTHMLFSQDGNLLYTGFRKVTGLMYDQSKRKLGTRLLARLHTNGHGGYGCKLISNALLYIMLLVLPKVLH